MADREEFSFEEENSPSGSEDQWTAQEEDAPSEGGRRGSTRRILLLVLLLVAAGAAGFQFLVGTEEAAPPPSVQVAVNKQPIAVPPRPAEAGSQVAGEPMAAAEEAAPQPPAPEAEENALPEKIVAAPADSGKPTEASAPVQVSEPSVSAEGKYSVAAGAFLLKSNLSEAERKVRESGFEPQVVRKKKKMDMVRLRVGIFTPEEGRRRIKELEKLTPGAFLLPVDGKVAVYAASFRNLDTARSFADRLYKRGVRVEEEPARVEMPLYLLSFGGFADLKSAREAAGRARARGLDAMVIKKL